MADKGQTIYEYIVRGEVCVCMCVCVGANAKVHIIYPEFTRALPSSSLRSFIHSIRLTSSEIPFVSFTSISGACLRDSIDCFPKMSFEKPQIIGFHRMSRIRNVTNGSDFLCTPNRHQIELPPRKYSSSQGIIISPSILIYFITNIFIKYTWKVHFHSSPQILRWIDFQFLVCEENSTCHVFNRAFAVVFDHVKCNAHSIGDMSFTLNDVSATLCNDWTINHQRELISSAQRNIELINRHPFGMAWAFSRAHCVNHWITLRKFVAIVAVVGLVDGDGKWWTTAWHHALLFMANAQNTQNSVVVFRAPAASFEIS